MFIFLWGFDFLCCCEDLVVVSFPLSSLLFPSRPGVNSPCGTAVEGSKRQHAGQDKAKGDKMRSGARLGRAGVLEQARRREAMAKRGEQISAERARQMKSQLESFKRKLEQFAIDHKEEIQRDPAFRAKFHTMCASIGVDPLTSRKGIWAELLGVGDYYYELGVRVIEVCVSTRAMNGGIISLGEVVSVLRKSRITYTERISSDDVERAVGKLSALGSGYKIVQAGNERVVQSVPMELSVDHTKALGACRGTGFITTRTLQNAMGWDFNRANATLQFLLYNEFAWLDTQCEEERYWIVGMVSGAAGQT